MTGPSGLHAILDVVIEGQTTVHPSILAEYQQDPIRGTISHIDLREVRLDQPIHATVRSSSSASPRAPRRAGCSRSSRASSRSRRCRRTCPSTSTSTSRDMEIGDVLRLADIPRSTRSRFSTTRTRRSSQPSPCPAGSRSSRRPRRRRQRRRQPRPRARSRGRGGCRGRVGRSRRELRLRGVAVRLFRRGESASTLDLLVAGLGNPGSRHERDRHNVGWMVVDELAAPRRAPPSSRSSTAGSARRGSTSTGSRS